MNPLRRLRGEMETPRLVLRHWRQEDYRHFMAFSGDPSVMLSSGAAPALTPQQGEEAFQRALWDSGCYAIVLKETGEPVGKIKFQKDLRRYRVNSLSIGYELRRDCWGRGIMPEALSAMVSCAFRRRKVDVLAISHFQDNQRSRRVIEKCGFQREGTIRQAFRRSDGQVLDEVCYSILKEDYFACPERFQLQAVKVPKDFETEG